MHHMLKALLRFLTAAMCLLLASLLIAQEARACSWDYPIWMIRSKTADPLYRFVLTDKAGYIDRSGKVVIKPKFDGSGNYGGEFHDGLLDISFDDAGYADTTGKVVIGKKYEWSEDFSEGLAVVKLDDSGKWGYINRKGEIALIPRFGSETKIFPDSFSEGLAVVTVDTKTGYIDRSGEFVIKPKFFQGTDFHDGMARVVVEGPCVYWDRGPCAGAVSLGEARDEQATRCKFTFIDKNGSIIEERFDAAKDFSKGLAPVQVGDKWGYVDKDGRMVIVPAFDDAEPFSEGLAVVKVGELYGYINRIGEFAIRPQFERADSFSDGLAPVSKTWNEKEFQYDDYYYINKSGRQVIKEKFEIASHFYKGLAHVKLKSDKKSDYGNEGTYAYIDVTGKKVFTYEYKPE